MTTPIASRSLLASALAALALLAAPRIAAADEDDVRVSMSCDEIQAYYDTYRPLIEYKIDQCIAGDVAKVGLTKKLRTNGLLDFDLAGCDSTLSADVTLKRPVLRDVDGTVDTKGRVSVTQVYEYPGASFPKALEVVFSNVKVTRLELDHIGDIREALFKFLANKLMPSTRTMTIDLVGSDDGDGEGGDGC